MIERIRERIAKLEEMAREQEAQAARFGAQREAAWMDYVAMQGGLKELRMMAEGLEVLDGNTKEV